MHVAMEYHGKKGYFYITYSGELTFHKKLLEDQSMLQALQICKCSKVLLYCWILDNSRSQSPPWIGMSSGNILEH